MKTIPILFSLILFTAFKSNAAPLFFSWGGEKIAKVVDFPGSDFDAGVRYKQVSIFFIPVWNYDAAFCGYIQKDDEYLPYSYSELSTIASENNISLKDDPEGNIPFWDKYGGKIVIAVLIGLYVAFSAAKTGS